MKQMHMELITSDYGGVSIGIYKVWAGESILEAIPTLHAHETYEMHFVTDGAYTFTVQDQAVPLSQGQCLILKPGTEHYSYDKTGDCTLFSLHLSVEKTEVPDGFYSYFSHALDEAAGVPFPVSHALLQHVRAFEKEPFVLTFEVYCRLKVLAAQIVYRLFCDIDAFGDETQNPAKVHRMPDTAYLIECMVNEPSCTLADISARIGYSLRHTTRIIKTMYGKTLREIRQIRAMDRAKTLLVSTDKTVEEIATEAGFSGASAMRRAFQDGEKTTPSAYRSLGRKGTEKDDGE
ncbi:MAG: helix-turn-helix transcriptional regulator [Clostridia bacterium]|nr:helix-turn-helix transcriptional regulator [Clostridia bacterium]